MIKKQVDTHIEINIIINVIVIIMFAVFRSKKNNLMLYSIMYFNPNKMYYLCTIKYIENVFKMLTY